MEENAGSFILIFGSSFLDAIVKMSHGRRKFPGKVCGNSRFIFDSGPHYLGLFQLIRCHYAAALYSGLGKWVVGWYPTIQDCQNQNYAESTKR